MDSEDGLFCKQKQNYSARKKLFIYFCCSSNHFGVRGIKKALLYAMDKKLNGL